MLPVMIQPIEINKLGGGLIHPNLAGAIIGEIREQHLQRGRVDFLEVLKVDKASNEISTMCASPAWLKWVNLLMRAILSL